MAEQLDLNINIGANTQDLQSALQKAENLLGQFQSALKKATNVGEINYLNNQIKNLNSTINNIKSQMGDAAKKTGDATQSLVNLSRIAQDAPYGFIGIANNINPMLESFQRLQKETGSTSKAITSMVEGLVGPAGLGLAVGIASSLLVTFSKEIGEFFQGPIAKLKEFNKELKKTTEDLYKVVGEVDAKRTSGLELANLIGGGNPAQQKESLKRLKDLYADNKAIQDAKLGNDKQYYTNLVNLASKQEEYVVKEKNNTQLLSQVLEQKKKIEDEIAKKQSKLVAPTTLDIGMGKTLALSPEQQAQELEKMKKAISDKYKDILKRLDADVKQYTKREGTLIEQVVGIESKDKKTPKEKDLFAEQVKEENKRLNIEVFNRKQMIEKLDKIAQPILTVGSKKSKEDIKFRINKTEKDLGSTELGLGKVLSDQAKDFETVAKGADSAKLSLYNFKQTSLELSDTLSTYATNSIMGLWSAMEQGMSIGEALGNMFKDLAKQIATAAIKAAIFQAIFTAITGGTSATTSAATGGFMNLFKGFLGLASGGVVTKPTLAMVGEGNESEAVMPLSKLSGFLNTSFNAGAMSSGKMSGGEFVLRGSDLVLATQRANNQLNIRRGI